MEGRGSGRARAFAVWEGPAALRMTPLYARRGTRAWVCYFQIVEVHDIVTEPRDSPGEPGDADCRRTQVDARHALPKTQRDAENVHPLPEAGMVRMA